MKAIRLMLALAILTLPLASCGKKSAPQAPPDQPQTYPRNYPFDPSQPGDANQYPYGMTPKDSNQ